MGNKMQAIFAALLFYTLWIYEVALILTGRTINLEQFYRSILILQVNMYINIL